MIKTVAVGTAASHTAATAVEFALERASRYEAKIVFLSQFDQDSLIKETYRLGAHAFVTKDCDPADLADAVVEAAAERGLLLLKCGIYSNCIRVLTPLVISDAELDEALSVWEEALDAAYA